MGGRAENLSRAPLDYPKAGDKWKWTSGFPLPGASDPAQTYKNRSFTSVHCRGTIRPFGTLRPDHCFSAILKNRRSNQFFRGAIMSELAAAVPGPAPLSETQRVIDTFVAPTKTFTDIRRKATFWGPLVIAIIIGVCFSFAVQKKIGWMQVFENNIRQTPAKAEKIESSPNAESIKAVSAKVTAIVSYAYIVPILIITAIYALLLWVTVNFGFGGTAKYSQIFAVSMYANLVMSVKFLLGIIAVFAGLAPDSFLMNNPVGSNIGYYLSTDFPLWLRALCSHIDIFEIWSLILSVIGVAIVAKVSRGKAAAVVVGWWLIVVLVTVGIAAAQG
jgi:Yip1 domain